MSPEQWIARAGRVQARVERIAAAVNRRRAQTEGWSWATADNVPDRPQPSLSAASAGGYGEALRDSFEAAPTAIGPAAEELQYHVMAEDVPPAAAAEIEGNPSRWPGMKILRQTRRDYPAGTLAAHVLGYLGPADPPPTAAGRTGPPKANRGRRPRTTMPRS